MSYALPHIERLSVYPVGEMPKDPARALKLNQNESPYPPSPMVNLVLEELCRGDLLRLYPGQGPQELKRALAARHGLLEESVFIGNGSSEIISMIMKVFVGPGGKAALPDPTFELYHTAAAVQQASAARIPTDGSFLVDSRGLAVSGADTVVLVNPNSPTGKLLSREEVLSLADTFEGLVVVDEAYMDFAGMDASVIPNVMERDNLLVLRTFSKAYGLSGARVGYALGNPGLIGSLEKCKDIYNVNEISARLALAALQDTAYTENTIRRVVRTRDRFVSDLCKLGFRVSPSETNFVLCSPPAGPGLPDAVRLCGMLADQEIYVRHFPHPRLAGSLRISIGTDADMARLIETIRALYTRYRR